MKKKKNRLKDLKTKRILFGIILGLIILSAIGFVFLKDMLPIQEKNNYIGNVTDIIKVKENIISYKYNNFQFEKNNNMWVTEIQTGKQPYLITFVYGPVNVENISIIFKDNYFQSMTKPGSKVYIAFDHDTTNASYIATSSINLITNLKMVYGLNVSRACISNSSGCAGAPVVTCKSNPDNAVIQLIESNVNYVVYDENCLTIYGSKDGFIKATEKVILNWYGIL
jgi:hypothetical protein